MCVDIYLHSLFHAESHCLHCNCYKLITVLIPPSPLIFTLHLQQRSGQMRGLWLVFGSYPTSIYRRPPLFSQMKRSPPHCPLCLGLESYSQLIGILSRVDLHNHHHFFRLLCSVQSSSNIGDRSVFCSLTKEEQRVLVALEILRFNDIIIILLNCMENMNSGKTYTYFPSLPSILSRRNDYVMKADAVAFIRLEPLRRP